MPAIRVMLEEGAIGRGDAVNVRGQLCHLATLISGRLHRATP
jgi:hypothetical protein